VGCRAGASKAEAPPDPRMSSSPLTSDPDPPYSSDDLPVTRPQSAKVRSTDAYFPRPSKLPNADSENAAKTPEIRKSSKSVMPRSMPRGMKRRPRRRGFQPAVSVSRRGLETPATRPGTPSPCPRR